MVKRVVARGRAAVALGMALRASSFLIISWLQSKGWSPLIGHRRAPWVGQCSALGITLWMPCWFVGGLPAVLLVVVGGALSRRG